MSTTDVDDPGMGSSKATTETVARTETTRRDTTYWVDGRDGKMPWSLSKVALYAALPLFLLLALVATPLAVAHIEDRLVDDARADLAAAGIDDEGLDIDFDYRDGEATGILPAGVTAAAADAAVDQDGLLRDFDVTASPAATETPATNDAVDDDDVVDDEPAAAATGPVEVEAVADGSTIVVTGTVLGEGQRVAVLEAVQAVAGRAEIDDRLVVSGLDAATPGADGRVADLLVAIGTLGSADTWSARLDDTSLVVDAEIADADDAATVRALADDLAAVPTTVTVAGVAAGSGDVAAEISSLQVELDALIPEIREKVVFVSGSDALSAEAGATLDKVVAAMERYPQPVVEVAGHTDDVGDPSANAELSRRRAAAVAAYLVDQGVDGERVLVRGAGQDEPIDTNDTPEGRATNRRVELTALENS